MSLQLSLLAAAAATAPMGLEYHRDFLTASEEARLLTHIADSEWLTDLSRRVLHFGYKYDYTSRSLRRNGSHWTLARLAGATVAFGARRCL